MNNTTRYEIFIGGAALPSAMFAAGQHIGFSFLVNDADEAERVGWMEWTGGIGAAKEPELFGTLVLQAPGPGPDAGVQDQGAPDALPPDQGGPDAGQPDMGAPAPDQGSVDANQPVPPLPDVGGPADAGSADAGVSPEPEGCSCSAQPTSRSARSAPGPSAVLLFLALALLKRRKR